MTRWTRSFWLMALAGLLIGGASTGRSATFVAAAGPPVAAQNAQEAPVPRPDLALSLRDLPPGYEEVPGFNLRLGDSPLQDRVLRRIQPGDEPGPVWLWTMTYQTVRPVTQQRVQSLGLDLAVTLSRSAASLAELTDWTVEDAAELGQYAVLYGFDYRIVDSEITGDGALALFGPGEFMSYLAVISRDGQALNHARRLTAVVNARIEGQPERSGGSARPAAAPPQ